MKINELHSILNDMRSKLESMLDNSEIDDLMILYDKLTNKSGYYFSDIYPSDIKIDVEKCLADILTIEEDIEAKINENAENIEF